MGILAEDFRDGYPQRLFLSERPRHAQRARHKPRLQHQPDVHDCDVREIAHRPEVGQPNLADLVGAFHRHRHNGRADPRCAHHELEFKRITPRSRLQPLRQCQRITPKATLRVAQANAGFGAKPESGNRIRATAMGRTAGGVEIPHAHCEGVRLRLCQGEKLRQVFGEMLAVGVHRDGVRETEFRRAFEAGP